ncbi:acyl-coenzyme A thioesterase PaaI-like protein [Metapseudomonas resinovorans]
MGRSTALAEGRIYDVDGKLYATGSTTCLILGGK